MLQPRVFNTKRLILARRRRGLTQTQLAARLEVHRRAVCGYESGEYSPSEEALAALGSVLDFPSDFFFGDDVDAPSLESGSFRSMSRMTAAQRDMVISQAAIGLQLNGWLESKFELPAAAVPDLRDQPDPAVAADMVRRTWGIGQLAIRNMIHLLEAKGVRVFSLAVDAREVDAFSLWKGSTPYIFLNTGKSAEHGRFDAAHELGHLVMHRNSPNGRQAEREADAFASAFLMPEGSVLASAPKFAHLPVLLRLKKTWGVSVAALVVRLHALKLLTEWQYRALYIEITKLGYRESEPDGMPRESSLILPELFAQLRCEGLSRARIAEAVSISAAELESLVFGLVMTGVTGGRVGAMSADGAAGLVRVK